MPIASPSGSLEGENPKKKCAPAPPAPLSLSLPLMPCFQTAYLPDFAAAALLLFFRFDGACNSARLAAFRLLVERSVFCCHHKSWHVR